MKTLTIILSVFGCFLLALDLACCLESERFLQWESNSEESRAAVYDLKKLWPKGIVYYKMDDNITNVLGLSVLNAMRIIESRTCIRFIEWHGQSLDYILIQLALRCGSHVGKVGGTQVLYLSINCPTVGQILHELMHSLGFWHEMSRSDRDYYIEIHQDNIIPVQTFNFEKQLLWEQNLNTPFDYDSIMMYGSKGYAIDFNKPTITPKIPGIVLKDVSEKTDLSTNDIIRINRLYQCFGEIWPIVTYFCNFENGLCGIFTIFGDDIAKWEIVNKPRGSLQGDHTSGFGYYLVVDAKEAAGRRAILYLPQFADSGRSTGCLSFYYYYRGPGTKAFYVYLKTDGNSFLVILQGKSTTANSWNRTSININLDRSYFQIVLVVELEPTNQSGGVFAVDDVQFEWNPCSM